MSRILFAEDDDALRRMTTQVLTSAGHEVKDVPGGTAALDELRQRLPDLVVLDYRMGDPDGFEVCRRIKHDPATAHVPVLILTAQRGIEDRLGGFDAGADDYLAKPFDPRELLARVSALLRLAQRGRDRNPTTGLPGGDAIYQELERRRQIGAVFTVAYFDLDFFKPFADRFGFAVADAAIREAASAMTTVARGRPDVFVGHVGGDDFVLCCPPEDALHLAEEARRRFDVGVRRHIPAGPGKGDTYRGLDREGNEREFPLTRLSAALVRIDPERWPSVERLGEIVAEAKRHAKGDGGGIAEVDAEP
ncbi:GGDEF domain-containing response regulator [Longimicrobium sp.]|uniref:GGDEF domain-containing response regulator n=1 Tax=Longimicrobium sp. TaxID=2029185 RepID=UPI002CDDFBF3|nr:response regulator [Longimicrobium sp.]HSU16214.1 response regulator [Longimicrobium sp.]